MAKFWNDQRYNENWEPVSAEGEVTGPKDWQADREHAETQPGGAWNFSPEVMAANPVKSDSTRQTYTDANGAPLPAPGSGAPGAAPYGTAPSGAAGAAPAATSPPPAWMNWQPPGEYDYNTNALGTLLGAAPTIIGDVRGGGGGLMADPRDAGTFVPPPAGFTSSSSASQTAPPTPNPQQSALENTLYGSVTKQMSDPTTVDRNDPAYQQQIAASTANNQRAADRQRAAAAARMHASGTDASGGFDSMVNRVTQDQGLNDQAFEAQLMDRLGTQNRDRQMQAQQLGAGLVGIDKNAGLTREQMAQQESQFGRGQGLTREQMALQNQQFNQGQGLTREQMAQQNTQYNTGQRNNLWTSNQSNQLARELGLGDLGIRQQGLGLQRELGLGDLDYRRDVLGQNLALSQAGLNMDAMRALLQGY